MPKQRDDAFSKIEHNLFKTKEEAEIILTATELEIRNRWMLCVSKLMDDPTTPDKTLVNFLVNGFDGYVEGVSLTQAYRDIGAVYRIVGKIQIAEKQWYRYMVIEMAKKAFALAERQKDAKGMAMAADKIGKYTRCDQMDDEGIDWESMVPPSFEPSDNVTLLENIEPIDNLEEVRKAKRAIFKGEMKKVSVITEEDHAGAE